jgi:hypothetical protein
MVQQHVYIFLHINEMENMSNHHIPGFHGMKNFISLYCIDLVDYYAVMCLTKGKLGAVLERKAYHAIY